MSVNSRLLRVSAWLASSSLCLTTMPALSQPATPAETEQAGDQGSDPPALAGRVSVLTGSVSFHAAGETQWNGATLNYPVTTGEAFWTEPQAGATLEIADNRVVMDDSTELDVVTLDQTQFVVTEPQGAIFLQLASLPSDQGISVNTPRGTVQITQPGRYEVVAGDTNDATTVTVVEGAAHVTGTNLSLDVGPQQTATIGGTDVLQGDVGAMQRDAFLQSQLATGQRRVAASLPPQARYMTGAADLQQYGSFSQNAQYGQVWYPNDVARDWAPYRDGHWAYVQPWGWTWVDNARWGFAPFHYGRWIQVNDRWGWVAGGGEDAGADAYPVYSPALVSFVDVGGAALAGAAIGFGAAELAGGYAPAWIPLGPREPYYPWYHARGDYFARINRLYGVPRDIIARGPTYITNIHQTTINRTNIFINRRAATVSPAGAFARGESLRGVARPLPERALADARPVVGRLAVRPTALTPHLPPAAARRFNVAEPSRPLRAAAPGPRITPVAAGRPVPELRRAAMPGNVHATPATEIRGRQGAPAGAGPHRQDILPQGRGPEARGPRGGAPGPVAEPRGEAGLPHLRTPGARPEAVPQGGAPVNPLRRGPTEPGRENRGAVPPGEAGSRPGAAALPQGGARPELRPGREARPGDGVATQPARLPEAGRGSAQDRATRPKAEPTRPEAGNGAPQSEARPPTGGAHPKSPRPDTLRPPMQPREERPVSRPEAPRPAPHQEAPRPAPRTEAPRPAPRVEAARPAPRMEAPRPTPRMEAPRPSPRMEAPRPAPRIEAPRPPPPPRPAAPQRPAPAPHPAGPDRRPH